MTDETQNTAETASDAAGVAQDASTETPAPETAADQGTAPDASAASADPIVTDPAQPDPDTDLPALEPDEELADPEAPEAPEESYEEAPFGTSYHAKHGVQAGPADHPRHRHTKHHA